MKAPNPRGSEGEAYTLYPQAISGAPARRTLREVDHPVFALHAGDGLCRGLSPPRIRVRAHEAEKSISSGSRYSEREYVYGG